MLKYTIKLGNVAVHTNTNVKHDAAVLSLRCVFQFCKWIDYCYGENYINRHYDMSLLPDAGKEKKTQEELENLQKELSGKDQKLEEAIKENKKLRAQMTKLREENETGRSYEVDKDTEAETRRKYIDLDLAEAGWTIGKDCLTEVPVTGMPNSTGKGYADYVLYSNNGKPLAVIEAKRSSVDPMKGSHQAKLYADCLENQYQQRPIIFITNGFEMQIIDDTQDDPQRVVSGIFTKEDLQRMVDQRTSKKPLIHLEIQDKITNRPYQKEAVTVLCESIMNHHRKLLLVQATGSGKTRVSISLVDVLRRHNYVKNILFLADRKALVSQAKKSYNNLLPDLTVCNLLENKEDPESSRMIFSTYPTMLNAIDETKKKDGKKLFTPAHFDLIIVDESHRSIYKKYQEIFHYFDAVLLGMTATPKDEIDKNTYTIFDLERGVPTYAYELDEAVKEGYLVDYRTREYKTKIMEEGIHYDQLSEEEKEAFELLIGVNGIGPKVGLSVLSTLSVYELKMAVISEDVKTISKTPGLGPKGAKKLILELKDKLSFEELEEDGVGAEIFDTSADSSDSVMITIEGLVSLGYSKSEAAIAVNKVEDAKDLTPEELLKKALKNIMI